MRKKRDYPDAETLLALDRHAAIDEYDFVAQLIAAPRPSPPPWYVFISYASEDRARVRRLYARLRADGFALWMDVVDLLPGVEWKSEIETALQNARAAMLCLSRTSVAKIGFVHTEARQVLAFADELPFGRIGLIPVRLEDCEVPVPLRKYQCVDLFLRGGYARLTRTLRELAPPKPC